ncbi:SigE family RNA polymerase sigma factor [Kribbella sandramycini]|uniref:RNA polymerase sigma-70 factor (Sigma-E family) n=2 Tax=Kribbella sandramycini TaxID=60450 RepID=A0A841SD26_9ACTN|nr:RNA polymerase sigma-70 factor (sigma-E family) [Kribbella sandramycini]
MTATMGGDEMVTYDELVRASEQRLLRLGLMLSGNRHSAEDLVQTVLARAHRRWDKIRGLEHPEAYLRTMVVNEFLSWRRILKNRELPLAEPIERPSEEDIGSRQALKDATWQLLTRLPRQQRAVLVLRYYEDLSDDEIATVLGVVSGTVRSNAARALASLRDHLSQEDN